MRIQKPLVQVALLTIPVTKEDKVVLATDGVKGLPKTTWPVPCAMKPFALLAELSEVKVDAISDVMVDESTPS